MSDPYDLAERLGTGVEFPLFVRSSSRPGAIATRLFSGAALVRQSILIILQTEPGERVMRPDFGCPLQDFLMEPNNPMTRLEIKRVIEEALTRWEPRIALDQVEVATDNDPSAVVVTISYRHARDGSSASVQLPIALGANSEVFA